LTANRSRLLDGCGARSRRGDANGVRVDVGDVEAEGSAVAARAAAGLLSTRGHVDAHDRALGEGALHLQRAPRAARLRVLGEGRPGGAIGSLVTYERDLGDATLSVHADDEVSAALEWRVGGTHGVGEHPFDHRPAGEVETEPAVFGADARLEHFGSAIRIV